MTGGLRKGKMGRMGAVRKGKVGYNNSAKYVLCDPPPPTDSRKKLAGCLNGLLCLQGAESPAGGVVVGPGGVAASGRCHQLALDCIHPFPAPSGKCVICGIYCVGHSISDSNPNVSSRVRILTYRLVCVPCQPNVDSTL